MFSTYFTEQFPAILREIGANYKPDAIYTNGWPCVDAFEVCHCVSCQKIYEAIGGVPPETTDSRSVMYRRYYKVYMERIAEVWKLWTGIAEAANPDSTYVGNFGESIWTVKDMKTLGDKADWFNADNQGRRQGRPIWMCAQQRRLAKSVVGNKPITNIVAAVAYESNELT